MKKSYDYPGILIMTSIITGVVLCIILVIFFLTPAEMHFKILKEECQNITYNTGRELIGYNTTLCGYTLREPQNMEFPGPYCITKKEYYSKCNNDSLKCEFYTSYGFKRIYSQELYTKQIENWRITTVSKLECKECFSKNKYGNRSVLRG